MTQPNGGSRPRLYPYLFTIAVWLLLVAVNGWYGVVASAFVIVSGLTLWAGCRIWARVLQRIAEIEAEVAALTDRHGPPSNVRRMTPRTLEGRRG